MAENTTSGKIILNNITYSYQQWAGESLSGSHISMDTETEVVEDPFVTIPRLALSSAFDGHTCYLIPPKSTEEFIKLHPNKNYIFHNCAFDFLVLHNHCQATQDLLFALVDNNQIHDTMLLDQLILLAYGHYPAPRDLSEIARIYANIHITKDDPYRMRYGEILDTRWTEVDPGFFSYAAKDAIATYQSFFPMLQYAEQIHDAAIQH